MLDVQLKMRAHVRTHLQTAAVGSMGDKSPKAKEKSKKQDSADKNQKKAAANAKAAPPAAGAGKKK